MHQNHSSHHQMMEADFRKRFFIVFLLTLPILVFSPTIQDWLGFGFQFAASQYLLFLMASMVAVYGGWPFYTGALGEIKSRNYGMMTLVAVAVLSGYLFSAASTFIFKGIDFYWEISTLVAVLLLGHWLEMRAVRGTTGALEELAKLIPPKAHLIQGNEVIEILTSEVEKGNRVLVKPGEKVPIDGVVLEGASSVNEAMITGESKPVFKKPGAKVVGGTINYDGSLTVEVTKTGKETALSQIMDLITQAQASKPRAQKLADRAANYLTIAAIGGGLLTFLYWGLLTPQGFVFALTLAITVVVIACPHALGLAIPTVTTITSTLAARHGILIKDMTAVEQAKNLNYIVFDKTGTLTRGEFAVTEIVTDAGVDEDEALRLAAAVDTNSLHLIARAVVAEAKKRDLKFEAAKEFKSVPGRGGIGTVGEKRIIVGNESLIKETRISTTLSEEAQRLVAQLSQKGRSLVWVAAEDKAIAVIGLADIPRAEAKEVLKSLKQLNIEPVMLTGDTRVVAETVAADLGVSKIFAEVLPGDKVEKIKELQEGGKTVAMVGDGVNDAPSLTQANIGIAIGAGTDVAIESAEIVLVKNDLRDVLALMQLSRRTMRKMLQNLVWAAGYNIFALPLAAGVLFSYGIILRPEWGAILMSASSVIVVIN
ncbi:MAG: heavy metal translocating P-type ATPase, partial [Candidatus Colwellbacteria bacterium]|nr:heavy metal translocating P-type ATPase [Candidatus Colwellbacteria bacterium]